MALARALLRDAAVVILDEPSTGLDAAAETHLGSKVLASLRGRTVLIITHNPRLITSVDRVIRIEDGGIVELDNSTATANLGQDQGGMS